MALKGSYGDGGKKFTPCPAGVHIGVCCSIYDIGTHAVTFKDKTTQKQQLVICWELPSVLTETGSPYILSKKYNKTLHEKAILRKDVEAWLGKKLSGEDMEVFDPETLLLGKSCQLQVIHVLKDDNVYVNIKTLMALPVGIDPPKGAKEKIIYDIEDEVPEQIPDWIKNLIRKSAEKSEVPEEQTDAEPF